MDRLKIFWKRWRAAGFDAVDILIAVGFVGYLTWLAGTKYAAYLQ